MTLVPPAREGLSQTCRLPECNRWTMTDTDSRIYYLCLETEPTEDDRRKGVTAVFCDFWVRDVSTNGALRRGLHYLDSHHLTLAKVRQGPNANNENDPPNRMEYAKGYWEKAHREGFAVHEYHYAEGGW